MPPKTALTIAGHDPTSGAGITADLAVFAAHALHGISCVTALTVQSTLSVQATYPVSAELLQQTIDCVTSDIRPDGIKIGMLATAPLVAVVTAFLKKLRSTLPGVPVVLDPVLRSTSGRELLTPDGLDLLTKGLLHVVDWITPNVDELCILSGCKVNSANDLSTAARELQGRYPHLNILATGGHLTPPDDLLLTTQGQLYPLPGKRIETNATHGTGCALSSALLANLVACQAPHHAARNAKTYVAACMASAFPVGHGKGPLNLSGLPRRGRS